MLKDGNQIEATRELMEAATQLSESVDRFLSGAGRPALLRDANERWKAAVAEDDGSHSEL